MIRGVLFDYGNTLFEEPEREDMVLGECEAALARFLAGPLGLEAARRASAAFASARSEARRGALRTEMEMDSLGLLRGALRSISPGPGLAPEVLRAAI